MKETKFKMTELGPVPKDWEVRKLSDVALINQRDGDLPETFHYIDLESVKQGRYTPSPRMKREDAPSRAQRTIATGDILYQTVRPYQKNNLYVNFPDPENYIASTGYAVIRCIGSNSSQYLYNSMMQENFVKIVLDNCTGTSYPAIKPSKLGCLPIALPPPAEQGAIAGALGDVDGLISALRKLIGKKCAVKQGVMQELLSGKRRLDGFAEPWVEKTLGEVTGVIRRGQTLKTDDFCAGNVPVVAGGKQYAGYHNVANQSGRSITVSGSGASAGFVSIHQVPIFATDCSVISERKSFSLDFLYYCLAYRQDDLYMMQTGGAQPHVYPRDIEKLSIVFPPTLAEQEAIARVLGDMDGEIAGLEGKLAKYEAVKAGMMQELLTGRIRLI